MEVSKQDVFLKAIYILPDRLRKVLENLEKDMQESIFEIRLRIYSPVVLKSNKGCFFIAPNMKLTQLFLDTLLKISKEELNDIFEKACEYSVHSHQENIKQGFLTIEGGHRLGLAGTVTTNERGEIFGIRNITSICFRISQTIFDCASQVLNTCFRKNSLENILILGPPMSGKTVLLRDLCRKISNGALENIYTCVVLDERMELDANIKERDTILGVHTDVLSGYTKATGIELAVRALSPSYIFCDEIGSKEDSESILSGILSGVHFIATAHATSLKDAIKRMGIQMLFQNNCIDEVVLLNAKTNPGEILKIIDVRKRNESIWNYDDSLNRYMVGGDSN